MVLPEAVFSVQGGLVALSLIVTSSILSVLRKEHDGDDDGSSVADERHRLCPVDDRHQQGRYHEALPSPLAVPPTYPGEDGYGYVEENGEGQQYDDGEEEEEEGVQHRRYYQPHQELLDEQQQAADAFLRLDAGSLVCLYTPQGELVTVSRASSRSGGGRWELRAIAPAATTPGGAPDAGALPFFPVESIFMVLRDGDCLGFRSIGCVCVCA